MILCEIEIFQKKILCIISDFFIEPDFHLCIMRIYSARRSGRKMDTVGLA